MKYENKHWKEWDRQNRNSQDEGEWAVKETRKRRSGNDAAEFLKVKCDN